jgi:transcriptional regulator with XRE-family HTH domain
MAKRDEVPGLGVVLREHRTRLGLTLSQVEQSAGVAVPNLSLYERGEKTPGVAVLIRLSRAYQVTLNDLVPADALAALPPDDPEDRPAKRK